MFTKVSRTVVSLALLGILAGCNSTSSLSDAAPQSPQTGSPAGPQGSYINQAVVQATCPQIILRDATASHRVYAKSGDSDPANLVFQASFADTTRSCTTDGNQLTINIMAQGRVVAGPLGKPGSVTLPIRVTVTETNAMQQEQQIYSQLVQFQANIPADSLSAQFLFNKNDVSIPAASGANAKVYLGFDSAPPAKNKKKK